MSATRPGLTIVGWKAVPKNSLRGFADVVLPNSLLIREISVHNTNGKTWAGLPSKPIVDANGVVKRDSVTGKIRYAPILEWPDRAVADRFGQAVIDAVEALHPGAVRS